MECNCMNKEILEKFRKVETNGLPDFSNYDKPFEMGLWVLWAAKEKINIKTLTAYEIADIIVNGMEHTVTARAIVNAFNKAKGGKIHRHQKDGKTYYEIMQLGKEHLLSKVGGGHVEVYYFEPRKKFQSKRILTNDILSNLKGTLKIVDPYVDPKVLGILLKAKAKNVYFLTKLDNLSLPNKKQFVAELQDFKSEYPNIEFRNYTSSDIHDRYIILNDSLILLGHSIKDLGDKESFAVKLEKRIAGDVYDSLQETFNRRWKIASQI